MSSAAEDHEVPREPVNPRRAPDVVRALKNAAKRDPHRDVLKPIGRICFLISLVVLIWLGRPLIGLPNTNPHMRMNEPLVVFSRAVAILQHTKDTILAIDRDKLLHLDLEPKQASVLMLAGVFGFGFYYFAVYLVAMNALRFTTGVGAVADRTMRRARRIAGRLRKPKDAGRLCPTGGSDTAPGAANRRGLVLSVLKVVIQMDPIERIDIRGDSTFALALEAQKRGHEISYYLPRELALRDGRVLAPARRLTVKDEIGAHFKAEAPVLTDLKSVDVVLLRQDPPFDMAYITTTHLLEHLRGHALVVNDPASVRNAPEKLFVTHFEGLLPPTLITADGDAIRDFRGAHKDIILKPLYGNGGAGVFRVKEGDTNFNSLLEMFTQLYREPIIAQAYVPAVRKGDKRIILVDGVPAGAINRIPAENETRSNMHVGGKAVASEITAHEREICAKIGPSLKERGLIFVGIDVIGDYLTEINVTSPTGIREIKRLSGTDIAVLVWDAIESRLKP